MKRVLLYVPSHREIPEARESWIKQKAPDTWVDLFIMRYDPFPNRGAYGNLEVKDEIARKICLEGGYDYFFHVEDDIVLPDDALELLLKENAPVIAGLHRGRPETAGTSRLVCRIMDPEGPQDSDDRPLTIKDIKNFGDIINLRQTSNGCLLMKKEVLEHLEGVMGKDWEICNYLATHNIPILCHTGVLCGHIDDQGKEWRVKEDVETSAYRCYDLSS